MARHKNLFLPEPKWTLGRILRWLLGLLLLCVLAAGGWLAHFATKPLAVAVENRQFSIEPRKSLRVVSEQLARSGLVSNSWGFQILARLSSASDDLKAGSYAVGEHITPRQLLKKIVRGEFTLASVQFIEGWTFKQIRETLDQHPAVRHEARNMPVEKILEQLQIAEPSVEGWMFPDTYRFAAGTSDLTILRQAHQKMTALLAGAWEKRRPGLPLATPYDALILASIVEKETGRKDERELVASVFINRLKRGMRLQTDPTVIYGLGSSFDGNLRRVDLQTDNRYNTYMRGGLPPTPIAMPGEASIKATLNPASGNALYFVARGDGGHQFSASLVEHNRAVDKYQRNKR